MPSDSVNGRVKKGTFTNRFLEKYNNWLNPPNDGIKEIPEINNLSAGTLKKTEEKKAEEDRVETDSALPDQDIHGFDNEIKSLQHFLLDKKVYKDFKSLVIVGEYGVGKTALCKTIFNDGDVKSVYAPRIWVSMHSKETKEGEDTKISVLKRILKGLGAEDLMFETIHEEAVEEAAKNLEAPNNQGAGEIDRETAKEKELSALLYALHLNLRWKKYLIVFDDVRFEDNWNEKLDVKLKEGDKWGKYLSDGFPKGSGGRVIYTTRDENVAKKLVAEKHEIHSLWPLSDHDYVWKIYEAVIKKKEKDPPRNDKKCIDELMNKSRGLPLAARLLAELDPVFLDDDVSATNGSAHGTVDNGSTPGPADNGSAPGPADSADSANSQPANPTDPPNQISS